MGGRRTKYKQPPPVPLQELKQDRPSSKKLGKRKADADLDSERVHTRPAKKAKEGNKVERQKGQKAGKQRNRKPGVELRKGVKPPARSNGKSKKHEEEKEPLGIESGGESEGWEDMSDMDEGEVMVGNLSDMESGQEE